MTAAGKFIEGIGSIEQERPSMDEFVERLRAQAVGLPQSVLKTDLLLAANKIEQLRRDGSQLIIELRAEVDRLRKMNSQSSQASDPRMK
jgi:hypothetical protein